MPHEIPNAFLIRALARGHAEHCNGCGGRMFVKGASGLCPFCLSGHPPRVVHCALALPDDGPFAPRLGAGDRFGGWLRLAWPARRLRAKPQAPLALTAGEATQS